jgi:hypothetical protein
MTDYRFQIGDYVRITDGPEIGIITSIDRVGSVALRVRVAFRTGFDFIAHPDALTVIGNAFDVAPLPEP